MASRTITLELLRDGPPHNQLLSPLTVYLAKCQNRPGESIRLSVEHADFLRWQAGLTYAGAPRGSRRERGAERLVASGIERRNSLGDASKAVTTIVGSIRSLIAELACEPCEWRHIHLIVDASELGALPFELANAAPGLMVQGERLFVQQNARVTLTRQTHRVANSVVTWPSRPRILCVIADGFLPGDAHVLALWQAVEPWIGWNDGDAVNKLEDQSAGNDDEDDRRDKALSENRIREAEQMLSVLENPTLDEVSQIVGRTCFTHVHVLAHGASLPNAGPGQTLYGLAFRSADGTTDVVDGDRLETALRHPRDCAHPTVVTLATCEGANLSGGILGPGGSVAHALHAKGVPLVVASQFPLSKGASVLATEMLYKALVRGTDPREALYAIRRELLVCYPETHDWASLVMYASLPDDLSAQLQRVRKASDKLAAETAVERLRVSLRGKRRQHLLSGTTSNDSEEGQQKVKDTVERIADDVDRLDRAVAAIRGWADSSNVLATRVWAYRLLARLCIRLWDAYALRPPTHGSTTSSPPPTPMVESVAGYLKRPEKHDFSTGQRAISMYSTDELLKLAKDCYEAAYFLDSSHPEIWVQVVALCWALKLQGVNTFDFLRDLNATRHLAWLLSERVARATVVSQEDRALAAAVRFETELLAYLSSHYVAAGLPAAAPAADAPKANGDLEAAARPITGSSHKTLKESLEAAFGELLGAASPIPESYRAHVAWKHLRRYEQWATERMPVHPVEPGAGAPPTRISGYIAQLEQLGVRRYWGPRG